MQGCHLRRVANIVPLEEFGEIFPIFYPYILNMRLEYYNSYRYSCSQFEAEDITETQ